MQVRSLCQEDPLEEGMATRPSTLPMDRGAWRAAVHRAAQSWTQLKRPSSSNSYVVDSIILLSTSPFKMGV